MAGLNLFSVGDLIVGWLRELLAAARTRRSSSYDDFTASLCALLAISFGTVDFDSITNKQTQKNLLRSFYSER
jgi:hypothetical protein